MFHVTNLTPGSGNPSLRDKAAKNLAAPGRLYSSQVVCGREFTGDSFIPTPKKIIFRDFEVGLYRLNAS
jgi:hypothetical protein